MVFVTVLERRVDLEDREAHRIAGQGQDSQNKRDAELSCIEFIIHLPYVRC